MRRAAHRHGKQVAPQFLEQRLAPVEMKGINGERSELAARADDVARMQQGLDGCIDIEVGCAVSAGRKGEVSCLPCPQAAMVAAPQNCDPATGLRFGCASACMANALLEMAMVAEG